MTKEERKSKGNAKRAVKDAHIRALEKALREERLAIAAIVKVMLIEVPDPRRVQVRLEAMVRAAEANPRTSAAIRKQLLDATLFVRTAIQRETGRPQALFEPDVGHVRPDAVNALVEPTDGPQQLGLVNNDTIGDVSEAHEQRVSTIAAVHTALVALYSEHGALTDRELWTRYMSEARPAMPMQTQKAITERRRELFAVGRVVTAGKGSRDEPAWKLIEQVEAA